MTDARVESIVEALLFSAHEPLRPAEIRRILGGSQHLTDGAIRKIIDDLREAYRQGGRSFTISEVGGGYRLETLPEYAPWIRALCAAPPRRRLSAPALETLAIIAYRQPITKAEIEAIRGVNVDGVLENLIDRGLIETKGRKHAVGKPHLYGTNRNFLDHFGLPSLRDLPQVEELRRGAAGQTSAPGEAEGASAEAREQAESDAGIGQAAAAGDEMPRSDT